MANIDRIVNVQIALRTAGVRAQTFSDLLLLGEHEGADRVSVITGSDQLLEAPFDLETTDPLYLAAQVAFSQIPGPSRLFIGRRDAAQPVNEALAACAVDSGDWYAFTEVSHSIADLSLAAAWAEANTKLFLTAISDIDVTTTSGDEPATALMVGNFFRTAWWYNSDPLQFPEVAAAARAFTILPGGETWANQRLQAVTSPALSETAYINITAKNGNTFERFTGGISMSQNGLTAGGEWIDVIRFRDWLCEEIRINVFNLMVDNRIPYTDPGIASVRQRIIQALDLGQRRGGIPPTVKDPDRDAVIYGYTTSVPRADEISVSDKAARILRDMKFTARLSGAIHAVTINGTLTYDAIG